MKQSKICVSLPRIARGEGLFVAECELSGSRRLESAPTSESSWKRHVTFVYKIAWNFFDFANKFHRFCSSSIHHFCRFMPFCEAWRVQEVSTVLRGCVSGQLKPRTRALRSTWHEDRFAVFSPSALPATLHTDHKARYSKVCMSLGVSRHNLLVRVGYLSGGANFFSQSVSLRSSPSVEVRSPADISESPQSLVNFWRLLETHMLPQWVVPSGSDCWFFLHINDGALCTFARFFWSGKKVVTSRRWVLRRLIRVLCSEVDKLENGWCRGWFFEESVMVLVHVLVFMTAQLQ